MRSHRDAGGRLPSITVYEIVHFPNIRNLIINVRIKSGGPYIIPYTGLILPASMLTMKIILRRSILLFCIIPILSSCTGIPKGVSPVNSFKIDQFMGKWYEIARLDHRFERGLEAVTAEYSLSDSGDVTVVNSGYSREKQERKQAEGTARFVGDPGTGHLKVSFFGPFYASYIVFDLDDEYEHAFVSGHNKKYLWLLSRTPNPDQSIIDTFTSRAEDLGFPIEELILVDHAL